MSKDKFDLVKSQPKIFNDKDINSFKTKKNKTIKKKTEKIKKSNSKFYYLILFISIILIVFLAFYFYAFLNNGNQIEFHSEIETKKETFIEKTIDQEIQEQDRDLSYEVKKTSPAIINFKNEEDKEFRTILSKYDISPSIRKQALNPNFSISELYSYKGEDIKILNKEERELVLKGFNLGQPLILNEYGVVSYITPYTNAWKYGIKKYDKIIGFGDYPLNPNAKYKDVQNSLYNKSYPNIRWSRNSENKQFYTNILDNEALYGDLAEVHMMNDVLILRIKKITQTTPKLIAQYLPSYLNNANGIIIDLRDLEDTNYYGVSELSWLLNGFIEKPIANITNYDHNTYILNSKSFNVSFSENIINKLKTIDKIVLVNENTSGSPEILAKSLNGTIIGVETKNNNFKTNNYQTTNNIIELKNEIVRDANGMHIKVKPTKNIFIPVDKYY